jgi:hypothetical protein
MSDTKREPARSLYQDVSASIPKNVGTKLTFDFRPRVSRLSSGRFLDGWLLFSALGTD